MQRPVIMSFDEHMAQVITIKQGEAPKATHSFYVAVISNENSDRLSATINSVIRQKQSVKSLQVQVFYPDVMAETIQQQADVEYIATKGDRDFYQRLIDGISKSNAQLFTIIQAGEEFFENAFNSTAGIFTKYPGVNWLTGIQTYQAKGGFNITLGNTAMRRWTYKIYERNLYKNSGRYIPTGSTFWRREAWQHVAPTIHFVSRKEFSDDIWLAFFKMQKLYTCKIYFSTSHNYEKLDRFHFKQPNSYSPIEDNFWGRVKEFFFVNNVPYLRWFYRAEGNFTPVIRFDHGSQSYFLSKY